MYQVHSCNIHMQDASADPDPTKRPRAKALGRFTYVYKRKNGVWKIHLFHSSQQPDYVAERGLVSACCGLRLCSSFASTP